MSGNGFFANPTNGDLAEISNQHDPGNCWHGNRRLGGGTRHQRARRTCRSPTRPAAFPTRERASPTRCLPR